MTDAKLKSYVERIDRLMTTMDETREDIAKVVKEASGDGYIPKTLRKVAARFHADPDKIATEDALLETYEAALGRVGKALAAIRGGATWNEASEEHDVPRATLARAQAVSKHRELILPPVEMVVVEDEFSSAASHGRADDASVFPPADVVPPTANPQMGSVAPPSVTPAPSARIGAGTISCTVDDGQPCPNTCAREGRCVWAAKTPAPETPDGEGAGTTDKPDGPGSALATPTCAEFAPVDDGLDIPAFLRRERVSA